MFITPQMWGELSAYIFIDRKIDEDSKGLIYSRFTILCKFLNENSLQFNRDGFNQFISYKKSQGAKNSYLNNLVKVGKYIHAYLLRYKEYDSGIGDYTYFKRERHMYEILEPQECIAIAEYHYPYGKKCKQTNDMYKALYLLLALTGMRVGEAVKLTWADVNEDIINIHDTKTSNDRSIPNNALVWGAMESMRDIHPVYIFPGVMGKHLSTSTVGFDLRQRVKALGMKKRVWVHLFRHSFCVEMLRHNDVTIVAKLLGHSDLSSTLNYTHYLMDDMRLAVYTHPLLRGKQTVGNVSSKIKQVVERLVDKTLFGIRVDEGVNSFSLTIYTK